MIINKFTKSYITNSMFPNSNWTGEEDVFVVEDESELAEKIQKHHPFFEFVEKDGKLTDVDLMEIPEKKERPGYTANLVANEKGEPIWEYVKIKKSAEEAQEELAKENESLMLAIAETYELLISIKDKQTN